MKVIKNSGRKETLDLNKIKKTLNFAAEGLDVDVSSMLKNITQQCFDGIKTSQIQEILILTTAQEIQNDPSYSQMGAGLLLQQLYKDVAGKKAFKDEDEHRKHFVYYIKKSIAKGLLKKELERKFDLKKLSKILDFERDRLFRFNGLITLKDRYLLRDKRGNIQETPQELWMRIAMGLSFNEKDPMKHAVNFYNKMSKMEYIPSTPTLFNSGVIYSQLSSCYLLEIEDNIEHIAKSSSDVMKLLKYSGGIGASATKLRASGSPIGTIQGASAGPIPFIKILDSVVGGINLGGRRRGALAVFMEPWHYDIERFVAMKRATGDVTLRAHFLNTSVFANDEFMKRAEKNQTWYLFDPKEVPDLVDSYGKEFAKKYEEYIRLAKSGKIKRYREVHARKLLDFIIRALIETSHPWITFKDPGNIRCPVKNLGTVHSANLCTEIFLPTDEKQISVCNLASINLAKHIKNNNADWDKLKESVKLAVRQLDNTIDANFYPVKESEYANKLARPVGLGVMGLSDFLEKIGMNYASKEGIELFDRIMEFISYEAITASAELAKEKGSFKGFKGSDWSKGKVPLDTIEDLEKERGMKIEVDKTKRLDWSMLRSKVKKGMRNATVLAIAPTATISIIAGTSQSIEPNYANIFAKKNIEGKFIEINENLVLELKKLKLWNKIKEELISSKGVLTQFSVPNNLKLRFKTAFETDPKFPIDYAARAQKWVDMSCSRNLYFDTKDVDKVMDYYIYAWKQGLKSTYYAFFKTAMQPQASYVYTQPHRVITKDIPAPAVEVCELCQ